MFVAGPLADRLMEPTMMPGGAPAPTFGLLVGTDSGSGMALVFIAAGLAEASASLGGYAFDAVRNVEDIIPDHDSVLKSESENQKKKDNSQPL